MVSNWSRVIGTGFIWLMAVFMIAASADSVSDGSAVILVGMVLLTVALSTRWIWNSGVQAMTAEKAAEKGKRSHADRVSRLVDSLSDEELDHLRARLSEQERMVPLEDLLRQQR